MKTNNPVERSKFNIHSYPSSEPKLITQLFNLGPFNYLGIERPTFSWFQIHHHFKMLKT